VQPQPGLDESKLQDLRVVFGGYLEPGEQTMTRIHNDGFDLKFARARSADESDLGYLSRISTFDFRVSDLATVQPTQAICERMGRNAGPVLHLCTASLAETWGI